MGDLFEREQDVLESAQAYANEARQQGYCNLDDFCRLTAEYGRLLRHMRRITKISDRSAQKLNYSRLDLLGQVHLDSLTGVHNRRFMEEELARVLSIMARAELSCISVIMIDIDFFKNFNDTYGHAAGDRCLRAVAQALKACIQREGDFVARYGGEEFAAVLPGTTDKGAVILADRMLKTVSQLRIPHAKGVDIGYVTISLGVTTVGSERRIKSEELVKRVDEALYMSKSSGRNRYTYMEL